MRCPSRIVSAAAAAAAAAAAGGGGGGKGTTHKLAELLEPVVSALARLLVWVPVQDVERLDARLYRRRHPSRLVLLSRSLLHENSKRESQRRLSVRPRRAREFGAVVMGGGRAVTVPFHNDAGAPPSTHESGTRWLFPASTSRQVSPSAQDQTSKGVHISRSAALFLSTAGFDIAWRPHFSERFLPLLWPDGFE